MRLSPGLFLCTCLACLYIAGCSEEKTEAPAAARPAWVVVATPQKFATVAQGAGVVHSRYVSRVGFEVGGRLVSRVVDVGTLVRKGNKLAALSATDYRNKATAAEADLVAAKATVAQAVPQEQGYTMLTLVFLPALYVAVNRSRERAEPAAAPEIVAAHSF